MSKKRFDKGRKARRPESIAMMIQQGKKPVKSEAFDLEVATLFNNASDELGDADNDFFEVNFEELLPVQKEESIEALFTLAKEIIKDVKLEAQYVDEDKLSTKDRKIEAKELKDTFKKVEKILSKDIFSLKNLGLTANKVDSSSYDSSIKIENQIRPPINTWIKSTAINMLGVLFWSLFLFAGIVILFESTYREKLFRPLSWNSIEFAVYVGIFFVCLTISLFLYPYTMYLLYKSTPGHTKNNIRFVRTTGYEISDADFFRRCLATPLSFYFFGYLPLFFNKRTFQDFVAGTVPILIEQLEEKSFNSIE